MGEIGCRFISPVASPNRLLTLCAVIWQNSERANEYFVRVDD